LGAAAAARVEAAFLVNTISGGMRIGLTTHRAASGGWSTPHAAAADVR
jgi:hypothetical protein